MIVIVLMQLGGWLIVLLHPLHCQRLVSLVNSEVYSPTWVGGLLLPGRFGGVCVSVAVFHVMGEYLLFVLSTSLLQQLQTALFEKLNWSQGGVRPTTAKV